MDRRKFLQQGVGVAVAGLVAPAALAAGAESLLNCVESAAGEVPPPSQAGQPSRPGHPADPKTPGHKGHPAQNEPTRNPGHPNHTNAPGHPVSSGPLSLRFLGTGAADWKGRDKRGELRRFSSILLDGSLLIDFTAGNREMLPPGCRPTEIFYTHSHKDHFDPQAALRLGIRRAYLSASWQERARREFASAAAGMGCPMPEIVPLRPGERQWVGQLCLTPLPANHAIADLQEQALIYLVEKGPVRLLYATDTGGIPAVAARMCGLDAHAEGSPVTAIVMEATMSRDDDYRLFTHSSVGTVLRTVQMLTATRRYVPAAGQKVYLTHLARTLHGTQAELDRTLPEPLRAAYDGLELHFRG